MWELFCYGFCSDESSIWKVANEQLSMSLSLEHKLANTPFLFFFLVSYLFGFIDIMNIIQVVHFT